MCLDYRKDEEQAVPLPSVMVRFCSDSAFTISMYALLALRRMHIFLHND